MNGPAQNVGPRKKRSHATLAVAPVTRAIRAALAVSATALALSVPVVGLAAGTCSHETASNTHVCNIFNQTSLAVADANLVPPVDLTVVPGDQLPSSVTAEAAGIDAVWASDVSIFNDAGTRIDTSGAFGAMDFDSIDDITLVDGGDAFADVTRIQDVITAHAFSLSGDISTDNSLDGTFALGYGTFEIGDEGVINADSINDDANGIVATAVNSLMIDNSSDINVSGYGNVFGIDIFDGYSASLNNTANITAQAGVGAGYWGIGAYATGARVNSVDAAVSNYGGISATASADGYYARARGVDVFAYAGGATVYNAGDIQGSAQADGGVARATGVYSFGYSAESTVENAGDIRASAQALGGSAYASAINSIAYGYSGGRDASVTNSGALFAEANADQAYALTVFNLARGRYANAYTTNANDGKIYAEATGDFATAEAVNNGAARYGTAVASNAGGIYATANGASGARAVGIVNYSTGSVATVDNEGSIFAMGTATAGRAIAIGVNNTSELYNANTYNAGGISVIADASGIASAAGVLSTAGKSSYVLNEVDGGIDVVASSQSDVAGAFGVYISASELATALNYGDISAQASGVDAYTYGALVLGGYAGIGLLTNGGNISAGASATGGGAAFATGAYVTSEVATIFNDGSTAATATSDGDGGMAAATGAKVYGINSAISNYGELTASASANGYGSIAAASGAYSTGILNSSVYNAGDIHASAVAAGGEASVIGVGSVGYYFDSYATNAETGRIVAEATGDNATATGMLSASVLYGDAITTNSGSLRVSADGVSYASAVGAYNFAGFYNAQIDNTGSVDVRASTTGDSSAAFAIGANAISRNGYGDAVIRNAGDITATADAQGTYSMAIAYGVLAASGNYGGIDLENDGSITTYAHTDHGLVNSFAVYMLSVGGAVSMVNHGDLDASGRNEDGYAYVFGAYVSSLPYGYDSVARADNSGRVTANVSVGRGAALGTGISSFGSYAYVSNTADGSIDVTADSEVSGVSGATGIFNLGFVKSGVVNDGAISAYSHASGSGLYTYSGTRAMAIYSASGPFGTTDVVNNGDLSAVAVSENAHTHFGGSSGATGIMVYAKFGDVQNSGDILASATTNAGVAGAYGIINHGKYTSNIVNSGDVTAHAYAGSIYGDQFAARTGALGTQIFGSRYATQYNSGSISATAISADPYGLQYDALAFAYGAMLHANRNATLDNQGDIAAYARADSGYASAIGVDMWGKKAGTITNAGDITAEAHADGGIAVALGAYNLSTYSSLYGTALLDNAGLISAAAHADGGVAQSYGAVLLGSFAANVINTGDITSIAEGGDAHAVGLIANSNGYASLQNSGAITAQASGYGNAMASGVEITGRSENGYVSVAVLNAGEIGATAAGGASASAYGLLATAPTGNIDLVNDAYASITAQAQAGSGPAQAFGLYATGQSSTTLSNYGSIASDASSLYGDAVAYAALINGGYAGIGLLINGGDLNANASSTAGDAIATGAFVYGDVATIFNDGSTTATASAGGEATATGLGVYGGFSAIYSYGDVTATASSSSVDGIATAVGADTFGYTGSSVYNAADIVANASADGGVANATGASSIGIFISYATNVGTISAEATGAQTTATGVYNASAFDAITYNEGSISAVAEGTMAAYGEYEAMAFGAYNLAVYYNSVIDNSGSITASASATTDISYTEGFLVAKALGAVAVSQYGYGETAIVNSGSITSTAETSVGYAGAWGAVSLSGWYGSASIENEGSISAYAHTNMGAADSVGAYARTISGTSAVVNHGDISANARAERGVVDVFSDFAEATGVQVISSIYGDGGEATLDNYGNIEAHASVLGGIGYAYGVQMVGLYTSVNNAAGASITATGEAELHGGLYVTGVKTTGAYGANVTNDGSITAYGHANAYVTDTHGFFGVSNVRGVYAVAFAGDTMVENNGDITAIAIADHSIGWATGGAGAKGIDVYTLYDATIVNTGDITAIADAEFGTTTAFGVFAEGYSTEIVNAAGATIVASASVGSLYGDQYAGFAEATGILAFHQGMEYAAIYNGGSIVAHAVVTPDGTGAPIGSSAIATGVTTGSNLMVQRGAETNVGSIEAVARADFGFATAYGAFVRSFYDSAITNSGDILASATAAEGNAFAVGSYAYSLHRSITYNCDYYGCDWANPIIVLDGGESLIDNSGNIMASASALGGVGYSYGAVALAAYTAGITNAGHISAVTVADDALAVGGLVNSFYGDATLQNSGVIGAKATGDIANASGVVVQGVYGTQVDNTGTIVAGAYGADATATAVSMDSDGSNVLTNTGTIAAIGDGERIAVASSTGTTSITNSGSMTGAILTGDLDDSLDNAAGSIWHAVGDSDFGAGDDQIVNHGTIRMDDAAIRLGGYVNGNTFDNFGTLAVSGAGNMLDMGNPFPVNNNGVISFVDGAADDMLTIVGDFAGQGTINVDVSGLNRSSDRLYIDGDVIESTTQTLNVNLTDLLLPNAANTDVALVQVSGDSTAANFVLGNIVHGANGFLTMDFSLNASIDASNAADDVFSLGVAVTGLNDMGSVAAALAPGAQSLVNAQVGTWRQRMGVVPASGDSVLAPWVRMFSDSGDVNTQHSNNFGPGGTFGFDQSNSGWELGLDTRPSEHLALGVLIGDSEGSQHLTGGAGSDRLDGRTFGLYGTWLANGFYLDVSQRWTGIDARLSSAAGTQKAKASADAFNVEAGFTAWTVGSIHVVPQAQYTHTRVGDVSALHGSQSTFDDDGGVSSRGRLGVALDTTFEGAGFTWTPYGSLNAVREFDGEYNYSINNGLLGTSSTEGTSAMVELGLGARKGNLSVTGGVNWIDGGALESISGGQLVVRYSW